MSLYSKSISAITGDTDPITLREIEDEMRVHSRGGVLDYLTMEEFKKLAIMAKKLVKAKVERPVHQVMPPELRRVLGIK